MSQINRSRCIHVAIHAKGRKSEKLEKSSSFSAPSHEEKFSFYQLRNGYLDHNRQTSHTVKFFPFVSCDPDNHCIFSYLSCLSLTTHGLRFLLKVVLDSRVKILSWCTYKPAHWKTCPFSIGSLKKAPTAK